MLVLTQCRGETVIITTPEGREIRVMVGGIVGCKARVCYEAARCITIDREKIHLLKQQDK